VAPRPMRVLVALVEGAPEPAPECSRCRACATAGATSGGRLRRRRTRVGDQLLGDRERLLLHRHRPVVGFLQAHAGAVMRSPGPSASPVSVTAGAGVLHLDAVCAGRTPSALLSVWSPCVPTTGR